MVEETPRRHRDDPEESDPLPDLQFSVEWEPALRSRCIEAITQMWTHITAGKNDTAGTFLGATMDLCEIAGDRGLRRAILAAFEILTRSSHRKADRTAEFATMLNRLANPEAPTQGGPPPGQTETMGLLRDWNGNIFNPPES